MENIKIVDRALEVGDVVVVNPFEIERGSHRGKFYSTKMTHLIGKVGTIIEIDDNCDGVPFLVEFPKDVICGEVRKKWWFVAEDLQPLREKRKFEIVTAYKDIIDESFIPERNDDGSAGYDLRSAEDIIIPSILRQRQEAFDNVMKTIDEEGEESLEYAMYCEGYVPTLDEAEALTKEYKLRATLVPTGLKAKFPKGESLDIYDRSSTGTKLLLSLPHAVGIVDSTYYDNEDNEGHIMIPLINNLPFDIKIKKGERIAQAIFRPYNIKSNDKPVNKNRTGGVGSSGR